MSVVTKRVEVVIDAGLLAEEPATDNKSIMTETFDRIPESLIPEKV